MSEGVNQQLNPRPDQRRAQSTRIVLEEEDGVKSIEALPQFIRGAGRRAATKTRRVIIWAIHRFNDLLVIASSFFFLLPR